MYKKKWIPVLLMALLAGLWACRKRSTANPVKYSAVLINYSHVKMNVVIYRSFADYSQNKNVYIKTSIDSVANITLNNTLAKGNYYYIDCYSDDYQYTNWIEQNPAPFIVYMSTADTTLNLTNGFYQTNKRIVFLDGGDSAQTKWKAIDAIKYNGSLYAIGSSVWGQLTAAQQYKEVTVTKSFTSSLSYIGGSADTTLSAYGLTPDDTSGIGFGMVQQPAGDSLNFINTGTQYGNINNYYGQPVYNSADTIIGHFNNTDSGYLFIMVKEEN